MIKKMYLVCLNTHDGQYVTRCQAKLFYQLENAKKFKKDNDSPSLPDSYAIIKIEVGDTDV